MNVETGHTRVGGRRMAVLAVGDEFAGFEVFGLAEIMRRYLFLEYIGE
jgi:hypothetical protein